MLEIKNLTCAYGAKLILNQLNFKLEKKEFLGVIGPNGAGKTTLLRAISGVIKPKEGEIILEGRDIKQIKSKELAKKIAVVPQSLSTSPITVEDFVSLGRIPHYKRFQFLETARDQQIVQKALQVAGVFHLKDNFIDRISSGERQLVLIAKALAQEPELLLLDEPTAHLDIGHQIKIMNLIKRLNETQGLSVLVVLHDLNLASQYCNKLLLLNNGMIIKDGSVWKVLNYETLETVYRTYFLVKENPLSKKPFVIPFSVDEEKK